MLLKNLMEQKQLDLNQPLLSVRRFSSTVSTTGPEDKRKTENAFSKLAPLPKYKSELKSGPVRNPGTVPFLWERSPGRPKCENKPQTMVVERPPVAPKLPPGRVSNLERQILDRNYDGTTAGQSKATQGLLGYHNIPASDKNVAEEESFREGMEKTDVSGSEEDDETYVDALDTLSRSESFFLNCSISGVSGLDGPDIKPSSTFSTDPQTRDFMMCRFLPAAKAMASEAPQHSTRKQPVAQEQPRDMKKIVRVQTHHSPNECRIEGKKPHCSQCDGAEIYEEEDDYDRPDSTSLKICGLLPQLCLQNSLCLLNPVPGMRKLVQASIHSSHKISDAARCSETVHKGNGTSPCHEMFSQSTIEKEKGSSICIPEKSKNSPASGFRTCAKGGKKFRELLSDERNERELASASSVVEKTLYVDSVQIVKPYIPKSGSSDMKGLIDGRGGDALEIKGIEESAMFDSSLQDIKHSDAVRQKGNALPETQDSTDSKLLLSPARSMHDEQTALKEGSEHNQDLILLNVTSARLKIYGDDKNGLESQMGKISSNLESSNGLSQYPKKMTENEVADSGKNNSKSQLLTESSDKETSNGFDPLRPLPPPLPKSPSESWLKRTLLAVSPKHRSLWSSPGMLAHPIAQASKGQSTDLKWETMVKTSNAHQGHLSFSEEFLAPVPEV